MADIIYPHIPYSRTILYVPEDNLYILTAREHALAYSLDDVVKTGSVVVQGSMVVGQGANGSAFHKSNICERVRLEVSTGQGYELCEGCHPNNHSESRAIANAQSSGFDIAGADLYLWGHWWACAPCWEAIDEAGIGNVYLLERSEILFNKNHPDNILGRWGE